VKEIAIGVDLGGSNLRIGAYTASGEALDSVSFPTDVGVGPGLVIDRMCDGIRKVHAQVSGEGKFLGVGVGSPGPLSLPDGVLHNPPNLPGWDGVGLREEIMKRLDWPLWVDSDANVAALAEARHGAGAEFGVESLCMITLGTGVGGGIVLDGRIWQGMNGAAGEVGHGPLIPDGAKCNCGAHGCLELYASATGIVRRAGELSLDESLESGDSAEHMLSAARIAELALQGNSTARKIYDEVGYALGLGLANLINTLNLPLYTVGGGVSAAWDLFSHRMFETIEEFSYVYHMSQPARPDVFEAGKTHICRARLGPEAGLLGAAMLPLQKSR
jgi:glucokinase